MPKVTTAPDQHVTVCLQHTTAAQLLRLANWLQQSSDRQFAAIGRAVAEALDRGSAGDGKDRAREKGPPPA